MADVTVVGAGLAGLVAAIECASRGASVKVLEARDRCGGRARSADDPYLADQGPHAMYLPSRFWTWLESHGLAPRTVRPSRRGYRVVVGDDLRLPTARRFMEAVARIRGNAPVDTDFRAWATQKTNPAVAQAASSLVIAFTYDYDPGRLSAAFALERFRRLVSPRLDARYVVGGWQRLVDGLAVRARTLGVEIELSTHVRELPDPPVIVAVGARAAEQLLNGRFAPPTTGRAAFLDVAVRRVPRMPTVVYSLDTPCVAVRHSSVDPSLSPPGVELVQVAAGFAPDESLEQPVERMQRLLDLAFPEWRGRCEWQRRYSVDGGAGAIDLPGQTWRDRPAVDQGDGVYVAGDWVAAPGTLSETAFSSASQAARRLYERG